jgi:hypothetical protein
MPVILDTQEAEIVRSTDQKQLWPNSSGDLILKNTQHKTAGEMVQVGRVPT